MEVSTTSTIDPVFYYNYLNNVILNPTVFVIILLVIISYFILFYSLGNNSQENNIDIQTLTSDNNRQGILGIVIIVILVVLILINAFQYFFSINVTAFISGLFSPTAKLDIIIDQHSYNTPSNPEIKFKKQVFNIPGNYYSFDNAKALCNAYDSRLATYEEIEKSYNDGGEWCNYGWSEGQNALFPTQQKTFDNLQSIKGHEHDCGRPGVNGGYIGNPNVRFGANCYGYKPKITPQEADLMENTQPYPLTAEDIAFQQKVDYLKNKLDEILVSPFNYNSWGQI
jgi:hypothetical protein